jgi:transposase
LNHRRVTIVCDLEARQVVTLLSDRQAAKAWLGGHPQIGIVARDRSGAYELATQKALHKPIVVPTVTPIA